MDLLINFGTKRDFLIGSLRQILSKDFAKKT